MGDGGAFQGIAARLEYPIYIVTATDGIELSGCLVGFATQCSINPVRFLTCISDKNHTYRVAGRTDALAVHLVPADGQRLAELFGGATGDSGDKFERCSWTEGPAGLPILTDCPSWFAGHVVERITLGDHAGYMLEPFAGEAGGDGSQYPAARARALAPGHEA